MTEAQFVVSLVAFGAIYVVLRLTVDSWLNRMRPDPHADIKARIAEKRAELAELERGS